MTTESQQGTERFPTSETAKVPTTSVSVNCFEPEQSHTLNGSEESEQNVVQGGLQRNEEETIATRVNTNLSALHSFLL